jgi:hypothetical protein
MKLTFFEEKRVVELILSFGDIQDTSRDTERSEVRNACRQAGNDEG